MENVADFKFDKHQLSHGVLLVSHRARQDFPLEQVQQQLDALVEEARAMIISDTSVMERFEQLCELFYRKWAFGGARGSYVLSDTLWLDQVLLTKHGSPVSLGTLFLHIAIELGLPVSPVIFPTQLILKLELPQQEETLYFNPLNGERLTRHLLDLWIKGHVNAFAMLTDNDLQNADHRVIVRKWFDTLKVALMSEDHMELALQVSDVLLILAPKDPYEIRDRGLILTQLDCLHAAVSDLTYFIEQCPDDPVAKMVKMQLYSFDELAVVLH